MSIVVYTLDKKHTVTQQISNYDCYILDILYLHFGKAFTT